MLDSGSVLNADDIVITNGSQSGMSLALLAVCQPGTLSPLNPPPTTAQCSYCAAWGSR